MKKSAISILAMLLTLGMVAGCGAPASSSAPSSDSAPSSEAAPSSAAPAMTEIDKLVVAFVPSREPAEIVTATEPLKEMLKEELKKANYDVKDVEITVGTNYEAVGEALSAGTADIGLIPGGTYVLYDDGAEVILAATRDGLSKDSGEAKDWNDGKPTEPTTNQAVSYRALIIAGPSAKGQELSAKVNSGEALTWDDLNSANWSIMSTTSPAGYIYPSIWLQDNFGKSITDLSKAVTSDSYGSAMARLASGQVDIVLTYADARRDYVEKWNSEYSRRLYLGGNQRYRCYPRYLQRHRQRQQKLLQDGRRFQGCCSAGFHQHRQHRCR